jgi:hypothetical protein
MTDNSAVLCQQRLAYEVVKVDVEKITIRIGIIAQQKFAKATMSYSLLDPSAKW